MMVRRSKFPCAATKQLSRESVHTKPPLVSVPWSTRAIWATSFGPLTYRKPACHDHLVEEISYSKHILQPLKGPVGSIDHFDEP